MHLYQGTTEQFIGDAVRNRLAGQLAERFFDEFRYRPAPSEVTSWQNSLRAMSDVLQLADLIDFQVVDTVQGLDSMIRGKAAEGATARLVAGFCWPWSNPEPSGELVPDVVVGDWRMPWNARAEAGRLGAGIPRSDYWATDPGGLEQVGCVYTAQGFEFDYVGVIVGRDLVYRPGVGWVGQPEESKDRIVSRKNVSRESFTEYVKSIYRVLLTRGLRGCYVHFLDPQTRDFVLSRLERPSQRLRAVAEDHGTYE